MDEAALISHNNHYAFTPSHVRDDPLIYSGRAVKRTKSTQDRASVIKDHAVVPPPEVTEQ